MRRLFSAAAIGLCSVGALDVAALKAQEKQSSLASGARDVVLRFEQGQNLRELAARYLDNSDLWPEILRANKVTSITDLKPGQKLVIPARIIKSAKVVLDKSKIRIQDANRAGAQVFAPTLIGAAIEDRNQALIRQSRSAWTETITLATRSYTSADKAVTVSTTHRDQAAQARLSDRQGDVQGQRPSEFVWGQRKINATLVEEEKIRTLSKSTAQVTFRDASRLRLNPNSQAVIQLMRVDPLNNKQKAKVNLINGDFYALLGGSSARKNFQVELPNVNASVDSGNFWVRQQAGQAKFTNYDSKPIMIAARGETLTLGENEGAVVRTGQAPKAKFNVLPSPILSEPNHGDAVFGDSANLQWKAVGKALGYWLEIASDPGFNTMIETKWGEKSVRFTTKKLLPGTYYWRVAALDQLGVPGERSVSRQFRLHKDTVPPFLRIDTPVQDAVLRAKIIEITGETEPEARIVIGNTKVAVTKDGIYRHRYATKIGENEIAVTAIDVVGNKTRKTVSFQYMPDRSANVAFSSKIPRKADLHFLTAGDELSLNGKTTPASKIVVSTVSESERAEAYSDNAGNFRINVPILAKYEKLNIRVITQSKHATNLPIEVTQDLLAPKISLDQALPRLTRHKSIRLKGQTEIGAKLLLNNKAVTLKEGRFDEVLELRDGPNLIEMAGIDAVGHVTLEKWNIVVDREAPEFLTQTVVSAGPEADGLIDIEVMAKDKTGLARIAQYVLKAGADDYAGYLRFNRATGSYRGTVQVPPEAVKSAKLVSVELRDDAGNKKQVEIN